MVHTVTKHYATALDNPAATAANKAAEVAIAAVTGKKAMTRNPGSTPC
jgi:hypothetical protein